MRFGDARETDRGPDRVAPRTRKARVTAGVRLEGIYAIVDPAAAAHPLELLDGVLAAGIRVVQYRHKTGIDRALLRAMLQRSRAAGAVLVVNDDLEAALDADGWHAGQEDLALHEPAALRARLGARLFGVSCGTPAEARAAAALGADYAGVGPFAATGSKRDAGPAIGADGVRAVVRATQLPVVAIGGICLTNLSEVVAGGAAMAAVISALTETADPRLAASALVRRWAELHA